MDGSGWGTEFDSPPAVSMEETGGPGDGIVSGSGGKVFRKGPLLDRIFHNAARKIVHTACETLFPDDGGPVLEILSGPRSLMPESVLDRQVTGTGASLEDLRQNRSLTRRTVLDLNRTPALPFADASFSVCVLLFGIETLENSLEVFSEVARVLKPDGLFLVFYSPVTDPELATPRWGFMDNRQRLSLVSSCFEKTDAFGRITAYGTRKRRRTEASRKRNPVRDQAPVWIVYSRKAKGASAGNVPWGQLARTGEEKADPRICPYCGDTLKKWEVPHSPFEIESWYETDYLCICFNDECSYYKRGWEWMWSKMKRNMSYRHMYNPVTRRTGPMPVPTAFALRDGILEDDGAEQAEAV